MTPLHKSTHTSKKTTHKTTPPKPWKLKKFFQIVFLLGLIGLAGLLAYRAWENYMFLMSDERQYLEKMPEEQLDQTKSGNIYGKFHVTGYARTTVEKNPNCTTDCELFTTVNLVVLDSNNPTFMQYLRTKWPRRLEGNPALSLGCLQGTAIVYQNVTDTTGTKRHLINQSTTKEILKSSQLDPIILKLEKLPESSPAQEFTCSNAFTTLELIQTPEEIAAEEAHIKTLTPEEIAAEKTTAEKEVLVDFQPVLEPVKEDVTQDNSTITPTLNELPSGSQAALVQRMALGLADNGLTLYAAIGGTLPHECKEIDKIYEEEFKRNTFRYNVTQRNTPDTSSCTRTLIPWEEVLPIDISDLKDGTYTVRIHSFRKSFTITKGTATLNQE